MKKLWNEIFFTSDQHYFHKNIIKYCKRPFKDINEMHTTLIKNHNKVVNTNDVCYHIGDFAFLNKDKVNKLEQIINKLNGHNILVLGNHDEGRPFTYVKMGFLSVHTNLILPEDNQFILSHDPSTSRIVRDRYWLVGHVHDLFKFQDNCINVGVDVWDFYPVSLQEIKNNL